MNIIKKSILNPESLNTAESLLTKDITKSRQALTVRLLSKLPNDIFLQNKNKICIHLKKDEIYYDHDVDIWYWFNGNFLYKETNLLILIFELCNNLITENLTTEKE